jgi:hypothetical protein
MAPRVAKDIISFCSSCKRDVMHTIVAMDGERIVRVLCRSCKKAHAYRHPAEFQEGSPKRSRAPKAPSRKRMTVENEWEKEMERLKDRASKPYAIDGHFDVGDKISHRIFGPGMVIQDASSIKMEVLFEGGIKLMVRGGTTKPLG